ncbi:MAG TPA: hypothetical protein VGY54_16240 [Polyangiaceae bacterium]|nr:hypothetical protein [Polyangiaceae bacterium]
MLRTLLVTSFVLCACEKETPKAGPTLPATPSASAAPATDAAPAAAMSAAPSATAEAPTPPKCPAGYTANRVPAYCIKLPAGYTAKSPRISPTRGSIGYDTGATTDNLMVSYDDSPLAVAAKNVESELKFGHDKLERKGDLPGGNKWFEGSHDEYKRIVTLIKGPPPLVLKCSFAYQPKKPPPKEAIDACKSIVVPPG